MYVTSWELVTPPCSGCGVGATTGGGATRNSVVDAFPKTQSQWEGEADVMYTDVLGLVTTAIGYLIDSNKIAAPMADMNGYAPALVIPWVRKSDGQPATQAEIIQDWQTVKNAKTGSFDLPNDRKITQLKISPLVIQDLTASRLADNEKYLIQSLPGFAKFPADAQMAIHGMAWAMGGAFIPKDGFKAFADAANRGDWLGAKAQSAFKGAAPQRKAAHDKMFDNAAAVVAGKLDPDKLWYPDSTPTTAVGHVLATVRSPVFAAAIVAGIAAVGGGIYLATRPVSRRRTASVGEIRHRVRSARWIKPSHAEMFANGKPIVITKVGRAYTVTVMGHPVVRGSDGKLTFEGRSDVPEGATPEKFKTKSDADDVASMIGRYVLGLGDFVYTYVEYVK